MRYLALLAVLLVLAVSGCSYYDRPQDVDCDADYLQDRVQRDLCYYNKSVISYSAIMCKDKIDNATLRDRCIDDVAIALGDFYPCRQHDKPSKRDACEAKVGESRREDRRNDGAV